MKQRFHSFPLQIIIIWILSSYNLVQCQQKDHATRENSYHHTTANNNDKNSNATDLIISGYLPDYRSNIDIIKPSAYLTDIILFSIQPNASGKINDSTTSSCCLNKSHYEKARAARKSVNGDLNILISVGGAGRSDSFADIVKSLETRKTFIYELIRLW